MLNELFTRDLKTVRLDVTTTQNLVGFRLSGDLLTFSYEEIKKLSDGTTLPTRQFTVDRSRSTLTKDVTDWIAQAAPFAETFRQENEDQRDADKTKFDTEAARWATLSSAEQKAEVAAAREAAALVFEAQPLSDPNPKG